MRRIVCNRYIYSTILILLISGLKSYEIECDKDLLINAHKIAKNEIGEIEISENNSPKIKEYLESVNIIFPTSYCAAGIYWSFTEANNKFNKTIPIPKSGVANSIFNYAINNGTLINNSPNKYDLIVWRKNNSWQGHIEWIDSVAKAGVICTIAFNTRNGNKEGVFYKKRNIFHPLGRMKLRGLIKFRVNND
jgi:hypothetical protein